MTDEQKQDEQAKAEAPAKAKPQAKAKGEAYRNVSGVVFRMFGVRVQPGAEHELTDENKRDEKSMKRLKNAVEMGLVEKV